jgi:hypothetical protein
MRDKKIDWQEENNYLKQVWLWHAWAEMILTQSVAAHTHFRRGSRALKGTHLPLFPSMPLPKELLAVREVLPDDSSRQSSNLTNSHVTRLWINGLQEKSVPLATDDICKGTLQCTTTIHIYRNIMSKEPRDLQVVYHSQVQGRSIHICRIL